MAQIGGEPDFAYSFTLLEATSCGPPWTCVALRFGKGLPREQGLRHEMAQQNSPGLQAWEGAHPEFALKGRPNCLVVRRHLMIVDNDTRRGETDAFSAALSGRMRQRATPGLKAWAILLYHFMAAAG